MVDLSSVIRTVANRLNVEFEGTTDLQHSASKGHVRETIVLAEVLQRVLPETIGVLQGAEIACTNGTVSSECDLVAYDRSVPPIYRSSTYSVLPIEAVLGVCVTNAEGECYVGTFRSGAVQEMEVWPSGVGLRGQAPNHPVLRWLKTVVVSDRGKGAARCVRWGPGRRTRSARPGRPAGRRC